MSEWITAKDAAPLICVAYKSLLNGSAGTKWLKERAIYLSPKKIVFRRSDVNAFIRLKEQELEAKLKRKRQGLEMVRR